MHIHLYAPHPQGMFMFLDFVHVLLDLFVVHVFWISFLLDTMFGIGMHRR